MNENEVEYNYIKNAKCEHCGAERIINNCLLCGAPVCCISCCKHSFELDGKNLEIEKLKNELQCEKDRANALELVASKPCKECEFNNAAKERMESATLYMQKALDGKDARIAELEADRERLIGVVRKAVSIRFPKKDGIKFLQEHGITP